MLSACGISAYWTSSLEKMYCNKEMHSDNHRLLFSKTVRAEIKSSPNDFVVVEVDPNGQRTDNEESYTFVAEEKEKEECIEGNNNNNSNSTYKHEASSEEENVEEKVKNIIKEHKEAIVEVVGSTNHICAKAKKMTLEDVERLLDELDSINKHERWWNTSATFTLNEEYENNKNFRKVLYRVMREHFPLLRVQLSEYSNCLNSNHSSSNRCQYNAPLECTQQLSENKLEQKLCKILVSIDLHLVFVAWLCGENVALWLSSCTNAERLQGESNYLHDNNNDSNNIWQERSKLVKNVSFVFRDINEESISLLHDHENNATEITAKELRRNFHNVLRRYYPFIVCKVRQGKVELTYAHHAYKRCRSNTFTSSSSSSSSTITTTDLRRWAEFSHEEELSHERKRCYVYLIVKKQNMETAEMKLLLSKYFNVHEHYICTAGLKDKIAITYQRCSIPLFVNNIDTINSSNHHHLNCTVSTILTRVLENTLPFVIPSSSLSAFSSSSSSTTTWCKKCEIIKCSFPNVIYTKPIEIGDLNGNFFKIELRHLDVLQTTNEVTITTTTTTTTTTVINTDNTEANKENLINASELCVTNVMSHGEHQTKVQMISNILEQRAQALMKHGFVNFFGQQRFSETICHVWDHTGIYLLSDDYINAVKSLFRSCPEVYEQFPAKMDQRFVPHNARDAQIITHALKQTYKMYFAKFVLTSEDVQTGSKLWHDICQKAIVEATPFALRTMWVHSAQSLLFNLQASFVATELAESVYHGNSTIINNTSINNNIINKEQLIEICKKLKLRIPGFESTVTTTPSYVTQEGKISNEYTDIADNTKQKYNTGKVENAELTFLNKTYIEELQERALHYALQETRLTTHSLSDKRKVANVPFHASWRNFVAFPCEVQTRVRAFSKSHVNNIVEAENNNNNNNNNNNSNTIDDGSICNEEVSASVEVYLPSSTYATIFLRELLHYDK